MRRGRDGGCKRLEEEEGGGAISERGQALKSPLTTPSGSPCFPRQARPSLCGSLLPALAAPAQALPATAPPAAATAAATAGMGTGAHAA